MFSDYMAKIAKQDSQTVQKKKGHKGRYVALIILLVIIGVGYELYSLYGALPAAIASSALSGKQISAQNLTATVLQRVYSSNTFQSDYSGSITLNGHDPDVNVNFTKQGNEIKVVYGLENISFIGTGNITVVTGISDSSLDQICVPTNLYLFRNDQLPSGNSDFCATIGSANYTLLTNSFYSVLTLARCTTCT